MSEDIFSKIVRGEIPAKKIYENNNVLSFMDIAPVNKGHVLVVPKKKYVTVTEMPAELAGEFFKAVHIVAKAVEKATSAEGYNILINNNPASGQEVPYVHAHIIPRFSNDGFRFGWRKLEYKESEMDRFQKKIRSFL